MQKHFSPGVQFKEVQSKFVSDKDISVDFLKLYKLYLSQTKARSTNYTWVQNDCSVRLPRIGLNPCGRHGLILVLHSVWITITLSLWLYQVHLHPTLIVITTDCFMSDQMH